ncbi:ABC transporter ATP-binding protein [Jatrophihabitans sp. YIM 134969]
MTAATPAPTAAAPAAGRIVVEGLTKRFGNFVAVDQLSFAVEPGSITGFLGPNGAGKTTTLRMLLGLVSPSSGSATIGGRPFPALHDPLRVVGAALEAASFHPGRTARNHLRVYCAAAGLPDTRADEVLEQVGLRDAAGKKVRGYSLGMRQRLGLATTLLGDPQVLILDEPANGLDPDGIRWLRGFLRHLADGGRTVLVSSHQLAEMQAMADRVVILDHGRLVREGAIKDLAAANDSVVVRTPTPAPLVKRLRADLPAAEVTDAGEPGLVRVRNAQISDIGHAAFLAGVEVHELRHDGFDLEQLFFSLTGGAQQ